MSLATAPELVSIPRAQSIAAPIQRPLDLAALRAAVETAPGDPERWFELGVGLLGLESLDEAYDAFRKAAMLKPNWDAPRVNLSAICETLGRLGPAEEWCRQAIVLNPRNVSAYFNLGQIRRSQGRLADSIACLQSAIQLDPLHAQAHWSLSNSLLLSGDFQRGWSEFEWRTRSGDVVVDPYPQPRWQGEPLTGKTLLVHGEQGVGDEILFASCYPDLIAQGARCVLVCEPRLAALFARSFPEARVVGWQRRKDRRPAEVDEPVDYQIPCGSVPQYVRRSLADFPERPAFLTADPADVANWRQRFAALGPGLRVGISWQAGGKPREREKRTMRLAAWLPLLKRPGVQWINLQYGLVDDELRELERTAGVVIHDSADGDPLMDLDQFAAKMRALDLVISVGNATVHLAGSLGVPAWVLLPQVPAWRWLANGDRSPWYESITLLRQTARGDWRLPLSQAADRLERRLGCRDAGDDALDFSGAAAAPPAERTGRPLLAGASPSELAELGLQQLRAGDPRAAEETFRQVLAHAPRHAQALCCLADIARATSRPDLAARLYRRALSVHDSEIVRFNLADALLALGQFAEASRQCQRAIELDPKFAAAYVKLGYAQLRLAAPHLAEQAFVAALRLDPKLCDARRNLALLCHADGRYDEALRQCDAGLAMAHDAAMWNVRGASLLGLGRGEEAIEAFEDALSANPADAASWNNLGRAWKTVGDLSAAQSCFERSLQYADAADPATADVLNNLGAALRDQRRHDQAIQQFRAAAALRPQSAAAQRDLGAELEIVGLKDEALACYERALRLAPDDASTRLTRALLLLERGDFELGWREYAWRWRAAGIHRGRVACTAPEWDGRPLDGATLLVRSEQGLGDEIMFASCWPELLAGGARLAVQCDPRLTELFARSFPAAQALEAPSDPQSCWRPPAELQVDFQIAAGDLVARLRPRAESFPAPRAYLRPDPERVTRWRERLANLGPGLKVGVSWRGGLKSRDRRLRWTSLADWRSLLGIHGVQFINLQYGESAAEIDALEPPARAQLHTLSELDLDRQIDDVAALAAALDLVIAASNVNIHLAGAVGTPGWALVPACGNWRWTVGSNQTLWYPGIEVVRQTNPATWNDVFERLREQLTALVAARATRRVDAQ